MSALHQLSTTQPKPRRSAQPRPVSPVKARPARHPERQNRTNPQIRQRQQQQQYRAVALETSLKIGINLLISAIAITTLIKVIPHRVAQQEKLQELKAEVNVTEQRVNTLQGEFSRSFDRSQERQIAQEQTHYADSNRTPIVWLDKKGQATANLPE